MPGLSAVRTPEGVSWPFYCAVCRFNLFGHSGASTDPLYYNSQSGYRREMLDLVIAWDNEGSGMVLGDTIW